ncbi:MAG: DNA repair protein RecO [Firmicutes bacterium]|nr:DNA repair protein RecO [Bacillota bacterium]
MLVTTEGIVLKQRKITGNRRLLVLFTKKYGKITAGTSINEKGKSKAALALRPFTHAEYDIYKGRDSFNINSAQAVRSFYSIGEDLDRFMVASRFIEYLDAVLEEGEARPKLFDMSIEFLESLTRAESNYKTLLYAFVIKALRMQGVMPELDCCSDCGKPLDKMVEERAPKPVFFSIPAGGIICRDCVEQEKKNGESLIAEPSFDIVNVVRYFLDKPISQFERIVLKPKVSEELGVIVSRYIDYYLGVNVLEEDMTI